MSKKTENTVVEEEEVAEVAASTEETKKMEPVDLAIMQELQRHKKDKLMNLGALEEYREQMLQELRQANKRLQENDNRIRSKYNIPEGQMWRVGPENVIEILTPEELAQMAQTQQ